MQAALPDMEPAITRGMLAQNTRYLHHLAFIGCDHSFMQTRSINIAATPVRQSVSPIPLPMKTAEARNARTPNANIPTCNVRITFAPYRLQHSTTMAAMIHRNWKEH
jgi:hypothetical protein